MSWAKKAKWKQNKPSKGSLLSNLQNLSGVWDQVPVSCLSDPPATAWQAWHLLMSILCIPLICSCLKSKDTDGQTYSSLTIRNSWVLLQPCTFRAGGHQGLLTYFFPAERFLREMPAQEYGCFHMATQIQRCCYCQFHLLQKDIACLFPSCLISPFLSLRVATWITEELMCIMAHFILFTDHWSKCFMSM